MSGIANASALVKALIQSQKQISPILGFPLTSKNARELNLSVNNPELKKYSHYEDYTKSLDHENFIWLGGYGEERNIYAQASLFAQDDRCIHLGVDITLKPLTPLYAPMRGRIHSFQDNDKPYDYGPTIILEHDLNENIRFYTLYGHLSRTSLDQRTTGELIEAGQLVGYVGDKTENGGWNPHVHFQLISDIGNYVGDYPGVASKVDAVDMLKNCPDPQLLLGFPDEPRIF